MSFLAPWFVVAGIAAVSLPILFHLFRRTPKGRLPFSTLMFLTPSPPRLTSRSRLENWPLLLMRAAILVLLALAFGRPLWRQLLESQQDHPAGARTVVLVDTSASMRRGDLWSRALEEARKVVQAAGPYDEICLMTFDSATSTPLSAESWRTAPVGERAALAEAALVGVSPSWSTTRLDQALIAAAESLDATEQDAQAAPDRRSKRIVLITDLQTGARTAGLQNYEWPKAVDFEVAVVMSNTSNAGLHPLEPAGDAAPAETVTNRPRVLVTNAAGSRNESFELAWQSAPETNAAAAGERPAAIYVPPGQTRVVRSPLLPAGDAVQLVLRGDEEPFDNVLWLIPPVTQRVRVLHLADEKPDDAQTLRYFLERAFSDAATGRVVVVETLDPHAAGMRVPTERDLDDVALVVVARAQPLPDDWNTSLGAWVERGGVVTSVLQTAGDAAWRGLLPEALRDSKHLQLAEADRSREYSLLGELDLKHPMFATFADPRYSDFSKIRFWKHRRITLDDEAAKQVRVTARFDSAAANKSGDPAVVEVPRGAGRVILLASGWQPRESQLGVSSKFVPLMTTLVELGWRRPPPGVHYDAGATVDPANLAGPDAAAPTTPSATGTPTASTTAPPAPVPAPARSLGPWVVRSPAGKETSVAADAPRFTLNDGPGIYEVRSAAGLQRIAANVAAEESKTAPLGVEALEALGVRLAKPDAVQTPETIAERQTLQLQEIESRQQLWRICLAAALGLLIVETWYAGRVAWQETAAQPTAIPS